MSQLGEYPKWAPKAEQVVYLRISDKDQAKADKGKPPLEMSTIQRQLSRAKAGLKSKKWKQPKKAHIFGEVGTGRNAKRRQWLAAQAKAFELNAKGKNVIFTVTEASRFGRDIDVIVEAWAPMFRAGIPIFETQKGLWTGTAQEPTPFQKFMFVQAALQGAFESDVKSLKGKESADVSREQGIKPSSAASLFPFARIDPLEAFLDNMHIIGLPAKRDGSGGGPTAFKRTVSTTTAPHGPKVAAVESMRKREALRRKHLSAEEYQEWKEYRQLIRNLLADLDYDPSAHAPLKTQGDGKNRWKASALWRYAGGYLAEPWLDNYRQVTNEEIQDIMDDPVFHLSDKDKDRHRVIVGKRKKKSRW